jgi:hypothetical protein
MPPVKKRKLPEATAKMPGPETHQTWTCTVCTLQNVLRLRRCVACEGRRPVDISVPVDIDKNGGQPEETNGSFASWLKNRKRKRSSQSPSNAQQIRVTLRVDDSTCDSEALYAVLPHDANVNIQQATPESSVHDTDRTGTVSAGIDVDGVDTSSSLLLQSEQSPSRTDEQQIRIRLRVDDSTSDFESLYAIVPHSQQSDGANVNNIQQATRESSVGGTDPTNAVSARIDVDASSLLLQKSEQSPTQANGSTSTPPPLDTDCNLNTENPEYTDTLIVADERLEIPNTASCDQLEVLQVSSAPAHIIDSEQGRANPSLEEIPSIDSSDQLVPALELSSTPADLTDSDEHVRVDPSLQEPFQSRLSVPFDSCNAPGLLAIPETGEAMIYNPATQTEGKSKDKAAEPDPTEPCSPSREPVREPVIFLQREHYSTEGTPSQRVDTCGSISVSLPQPQISGVPIWEQRELPVDDNSAHEEHTRSDSKPLSLPGNSFESKDKVAETDPTELCSPSREPENILHREHSSTKGTQSQHDDASGAISVSLPQSQTVFEQRGLHVDDNSAQAERAESDSKPLSLPGRNFGSKGKAPVTDHTKVCLPSRESANILRREHSSTKGTPSQPVDTCESMSVSLPQSQISGVREQCEESHSKPASLPERNFENHVQKQVSPASARVMLSPRNDISAIPCEQLAFDGPHAPPLNPGGDAFEAVGPVDQVPENYALVDISNAPQDESDASKPPFAQNVDPGTEERCRSDSKQSPMSETPKHSQYRHDDDAAAATDSSQEHVSRRPSPSQQPNSFFYTPATQSQEQSTQESDRGPSQTHRAFDDATSSLALPTYVDQESPLRVSNRNEMSKETIYESSESVTDRARPLQEPPTTTDASSVATFMPSGFGKTINVLAASSATTKRILGADTARHLNCPSPLDSTDSLDQPSTTTTASSTASCTAAGSGKAIHVSAASLMKANQLLGAGTEQQDYPSGLNTAGAQQETSTTTTTPSVATFTTGGSGKIINVSATSLASATKLLGSGILQEDHPSHVDETEAQQESSPSVTTPSVAAFMTAGSGKTINVSTSSLMKANQLLGADNQQQNHPSRLDRTGVLDQPSTTTTALSVASFMTAGSRKTINVSAATLMKANRLLGAGTEHQDYLSGLNTAGAQQEPLTTTTAPSVAAFMTAGSGNTINVSTASLMKANQLLGAGTEQQGYPSYSNTVGNEQAPLATTTAPSVATFMTAGSGKTINVSTASVMKANQLLGASTEQQDCPSGLNMTRAQQEPLTTTTAPSIAAFMTAGSGNTANVSTASLMKASQLLGADNQQQNHPSCLDRTGVLDQPSTEITAPPLITVTTSGFGKTIDVSATSLTTARFFLDASTEDQDRPSHECRTGAQQELLTTCTTTAPSVAALMTAGSGNTVNVSTTILRKASQLLGVSTEQQDYLSGLNMTRAQQKSSTTTTAPSVASFMTAGSGKTVNVSTASLVKAKQLLGAGIEQEDYPTGLNTAGAQHELSTTTTAPFVASFMTAGIGKTVNVSPTSLMKANKLLGAISSTEEQNHPSRFDMTGSEQDLSTTTTTPLVATFMTAGSRKSVNVSSASLTNAAKLLGADTEYQNHRTRLDMTGALDQPSTATASSSAFTTAFTTAGSGKSVNVSAASLETATKLLVADNQQQNYHSRLDRTGALDQPSTTTTAPSLASFMTAGSGKTIDVSADSLATATKLFGAGTEQQDHPWRVPITPNVDAFHSAGSGNFAAESAYGASNTTMLLDAGTGEEERARPSDLSFTPNITSFHSAGSGKSVAVSAASLMNANTLFDNDTGEEEYPPKRPSRVSFTPSVVSLHSAAAWRLKAEAKEEASQDSPLRRLSFTSTPSTAAFHSAVGMRLEASSESSAKAGTIVSVSDKDRKEAPQHLPLRRVSFSSTPSVAAFHSATGSRVRVSSAALAKAEAAFSEYSKDEREEASHDLSSRRISFGCTQKSDSVFSKDDDALALGRPTLLPESAAPTEWNGAETEGQTSVQDDMSIISKCETHLEPALGSQGSFAEAFTTHIEDSIEDKMSPITLLVNSTNSLLLRFDSAGGKPISFAQSELSEDGVVGNVKDIYESLISQNCDESMLSEKWIANHTRWVVWKLASVERCSSHLAGQYLTYSRLIDQLKRRFEKEIKGGKRPALRRVLNRDAAASRLMILCVARVISLPRSDGEMEPHYGLELTDGWYSIEASTDRKLSGFIEKGVIRVGTKLLTSSAVLVGAEDGVDPLDPSFDASKTGSGVYLRITANATRLARWTAKLGFVSISPTIASHEGMLLVKKVSDILAGGGSVPLIDLVILRKYPVLYLEGRRGSEKAQPTDATSRARIFTEGEENERRRDQEKGKSKMVERFTDEVEEECVQDVDERAPDIWHRLMKSRSTSDFYADLQESEKLAIDNWTQRRSVLLQDRMRQEIDARLEENDELLPPSTPFLRVRVKGFGARKFDGDGADCEEALLTIWNPSTEQLDAIKEGAVVRMKYVAVRDNKYEGRIQLSTNGRTAMSTIFDKLPQSEISKYTTYSARTFSRIFRIHVLSKQMLTASVPEHSPMEVDVCGIILNVEKRPGCPGWLVYLVDDSGLILRVQSDLERHGHSSFLTPTRSTRENVERPPALVAFRDLMVLPFDSVEKCAVAQFKDTSSFHQRQEEGKLDDLSRWAVSNMGRRRLQKLVAFFNADIPIFDCPVTKPWIAVGYIAGFHVLPSQQLVVRVDCGGYRLQTWKFPLALISCFAASCTDLSESVILNPEEEATLAQLASLARVFRARQSMYRFSLHRLAVSPANFPDCHYEVDQITSANTEALGSLYTSFLQ